MFGGISFNPNFFKSASILFEHNSKGFNTGFRWTVVSKINFMVGLWDLKKPNFTVNYSF